MIDKSGACAALMLADLYEMNKVSLADLIKCDGLVVATPTAFGGLEVDEVFLFDCPLDGTARDRALVYMTNLNKQRRQQIGKPRLVCMQREPMALSAFVPVARGGFRVIK